MLEPTKDGYPHPKTKEKPQYYGRRSAITKKSKPIPAGWATHKLENNYTRESGFEAQWGLIAGIPQDCTQGLVNTRTLGKKE